jgi:hypothetical protein
LLENMLLIPNRRFRTTANAAFYGIMPGRAIAQ